MSNISKVNINRTNHGIAFEKALTTVTAKGTLIKASNAYIGQTISLPTGASIKSMNMFPINAVDRETNGITFTVDSNDPNTVQVSGTASANAYSAGTITSSNGTLLEAGDYYLKTFGSKSGLLRVYIDFIDYASGEKTTDTRTLSTTSKGYVLPLEAKTYVGVRIAVPRGNAVTTPQTVKVMFTAYMMNRYYPAEYYPYYSQNNGVVQSEDFVISNPSAGSVSYFIKNTDEMKKVHVATFNVGDYSGSGGWQEDVNVPTGDMDKYGKYIGSLGADVFCTQEDREYYNITDKVTMREEFYDVMYRYGGVISKAITHGNTMAKGIYSNFVTSNEGKYTFVNQGTTEVSGTNFWNSLSYCTINIKGKEILVVSAHLCPKAHNTAVRKTQIGEMLTLIGNLGFENIIICGDFNVWEDEYDEFGDGWKFANCGVFGVLDTYDSANSHPFDNIIVSDNLFINNVKVHTDNDFDDHFALTADVYI